ncbi:MAG: hypothetical protein ACYC35_03365 [Pirellulales bacterium]
MFAKLFKMNCTAVLAAALVAWSIGGFTTSAYAQGCCGSHGSGHGEGHAGHQHEADDAAGAQANVQPPHGGQVTKMEPLTFEVVYQPQEIRVYIYGFMPYPESAKDARGEAVMEVRGNPQVFRYPLRYVAPPVGSRAQDYLATPVDLTQIRDGDMRVTLNLENLPLPHRPSVSFTQTFALSKATPQVTLAALDESDRAGIARQRVCPVTGGELGGMGDPIKVLIDGQPLYLCCQGCVAKVKNNPVAYLPKATPRVTLAALGEGDRDGIARQQVCPVTGERLGGMGDPIKVLVDGQPLYLCCQGCVAKVKTNPEAYLAKVGQSHQGY